MAWNKQRGYWKQSTGKTDWCKKSRGREGVQSSSSVPPKYFSHTTGDWVEASAKGKITLLFTGNSKCPPFPYFLFSQDHWQSNKAGFSQWRQAAFTMYHIQSHEGETAREGGFWRKLEHPQVQKGIGAMVAIAILPNGGIVAEEDFALSVHSHWL